MYLPHLKRRAFFQKYASFLHCIFMFIYFFFNFSNRLTWDIFRVQNVYEGVEKFNYFIIIIYLHHLKRRAFFQNYASFLHCNLMLIYFF